MNPQPSFLVKVSPDAESLARAAADCLTAELAKKPNLTILVATGNTPMAMYRELTRRQQSGECDFSQATAIQLDEYEGVDENNEMSLYGWMKRSFLDPLKFDPERVIRLHGEAVDPIQACAEYDQVVREIGGIDFAILGLGPNGHLGFNEPPSPVEAPTRRVQLTEASLASNRIYWSADRELPHRALTAGMPWIMDAASVLLLVSGPAKQEILRKTLKEQITPEVPASLLRLRNKPTWILADAAAMA